MNENRCMLCGAKLPTEYKKQFCKDCENKLAQEFNRHCLGNDCLYCEYFSTKHDCREQLYAKYIKKNGYRETSNVVSEIFNKIHEKIDKALVDNYKERDEYFKKHTSVDDKFLSMIDGKIYALLGIDDFLTELEKKRVGEKNYDN